MYTWRFSWPMLIQRFVERKHRIELQIVLLRLLSVFALPISSPPGLQRVLGVQCIGDAPLRISRQILRA